MVSVSIPDNLWIPFLKQSIDLRTSASERIREFIQEEISDENGQNTPK